MNISLPPDPERFVSQMVESGRCTTPDEVIWIALRLFRDQEELRRIRLEELRKEIAIGIAQADRRELIDEDEVFAELEERLRKNSGQAP